MANGYGGARKGAGRKFGPLNGKAPAAHEAADAARALGVSPLEALLECMRKHYALGNLDRAAEVARWAAPYLHAKLSSLDVAATVTSASPVQFIEVAGRDGDGE
jgi:hypothetical protein